VVLDGITVENETGTMTLPVLLVTLAALALRLSFNQP
jgi:hypothetical protein